MKGLSGFIKANWMILSIVLIITLTLIPVYAVQQNKEIYAIHTCATCAECVTEIGGATAGDTISLTADIAGQATTCITDPANFNGLIFDCNGHTIDGDGGSSDIAFNLVGQDNNTIQNCIITDFGYGAYFNTGSDNNTWYNNSHSPGGTYGIRSSSTSTFNNIINSTFSGQTYGIYPVAGANNWTIINNTLYSGATYPIYVQGDSAIVSNNTIYSPTTGTSGIQVTGKYNNITNNVITGRYMAINFNAGSYNRVIDNSLTSTTFIAGGYGDIKVDATSVGNVFTNNNFNGTTSSFTGQNFIITQVRDNKRPIKANSILVYYNVSNATTAANGWLYLNLSYNQIIVENAGYFEGNLTLWRFNESQTEETSGADLTNNYIYKNITNWDNFNSTWGLISNQSKYSAPIVPVSYSGNFSSQVSPLVYYPNNNIGFQINYTDATLQTVQFVSNYTGSTINYTYPTVSNTSNEMFYINLTDEEAEYFTYQWLVNNTAGSTNISDTYSFTISKNTSIYPQITNLTPSNITYYLTYYSSSLWANVSTNIDASWCGASMNHTTNQTLTNSSGNWNYQFTNLVDSNSNITFFCNNTGDENYTSNINATEIYNFTINAPNTYDCNSCDSCEAAITAASPGDTVRMTTNITVGTAINTESCINAPSDFNNITFDCQGYNMTGRGTFNRAGSGIYLASITYPAGGMDYNTIQNCVLYNFDNGITLFNTTGNTFINNTVNSLDIYGSASDRQEKTGFSSAISSNLTLRNNNFSAFEVYAELDPYHMGQNNYNHDIDTSNYVNNHKIYYDVGKNDYTYDLTTAPDAGVVYCIGCNNVTVKDLNLSNSFADFQQTGVHFYNTNNSFIENVTSSRNRYGAYIEASSNVTLNESTFNANRVSNVHLFDSNNNTVKDNTILNSIKNLYLHDSTNNMLYNNIIKSSEIYGIYLDNSASNTLLSNEINNNKYGFWALSSASNTIDGNIFNYNINDTVDTNANTYTNNKLYNSKKSNFIRVSNQSGDAGIKHPFIISLIKSTGAANTIKTLNSFSMTPIETMVYANTTTLVRGNVTMTDVGIYSVIINYTDVTNNEIYYAQNLFSRTNTGANYSVSVKYYLRPQLYAVNGQPAGLDSKTSLYAKPTEDESNWCASWVQNSPDDAPLIMNGTIKNISLAYWFSTDGLGVADIGIEQHSSSTTIVDYSQVITSPDYTFTYNYSVFNDLTWSMTTLVDWWDLAWKLDAGIPYLHTNTTNASYVLIDYQTPVPNAVMTDQAGFVVLSSKFNATNLTMYDLYLNGTGDVNLELNMLTDSTYTIYLNGISCDTINTCNYTQNRRFIDVNATLTGYDVLSTYSLLGGGADTTPPTVTWVSRHPDLTSTNILNNEYNITYNIYDEASMINESTVRLWFKTNTTSSDKFYYMNGTSISGWQDSLTNNGHLDISRSNLTNMTFNFTLEDNAVYPGTYNIEADYFEHATKSSYTLSSDGTYLKTRMYNVSAWKQYNFFEIYANNTTTTALPLRMYYCNSTYTTGKPSESTSCSNFGTIIRGTAYNHSHASQNSWDYVLPLGLNSTTGKIGNVKVTNQTSYFIATGLEWKIYYVSNNTGSTQTTTSEGETWSALTGTTGIHLHSYDGTEVFYYYACANDTSGNQKCDTTNIKSDSIGLDSLPPSSPIVYVPNTTEIYQNNINIRYYASVSSAGSSISFCNISLYDTSYNYVATISSNNGNNLNRSWNTGSYNGNYTIGVQANNSLGLWSSIGFSNEFRIGNNYQCYYTNNTGVNITSGITVSLGENLRCNDTSVFITQDANIYNEGNLTFDNFNLTLNCSADGSAEFISYNTNTKLVINNSNVTSSSNHYTMSSSINSVIIINYSTIQESGWANNDNERGIETLTGGKINITNSTLSNNYIGVTLQTDNNYLSNNTITTSGSYGVYLLNSNTNTINNNNFSITKIYGSNSNYSVISNNTLVGNGGLFAGNGLYLTNSDYNTIENNTISKYGYDLYLTSSKNNIVKTNTVYSGSTNAISNFGGVNNTFDLNIVYSSGRGFDTSTSNTSIYSNNTIYDCGTGLVDEDSNNDTISNNTVYGTVGTCAYGLGPSTTTYNSTFEYNTIYNCTNGVYISANSVENMIRFNTVDNATKGIYVISGSTNNTFINNNIKNNYDGIYLTSDSNTITSNNITSSGNTGIYVEYSKFNNILNNNITYSYQYNLWLQASNYTNITNNILTDSVYGIVNDISTNNTFTGNTANYNSADGFYIGGTVNSTFINNTLNYNTQYGINLISNANSNNFYNTTIKHNQDTGVFTVFTCNNNNFYDSQIMNNTDWDIVSVDSRNMTFYNTQINNTNASFVGYRYNLKEIFDSNVPANTTTYKLDYSYLNITNDSIATAWIDLNLSYDETKIISNENSVKLYRHNGLIWESLPSIVDTTLNFVHYNLTSFSPFAAMESKDTESPQYYNLTESTTSGLCHLMPPIQTYYFNVTVTDNFDVSDVLFELNATNYSFRANQIVNLSTANNTFMWNSSSITSGLWYYKWYMNDTVNNWNSTNMITYSILACPSGGIVVPPGGGGGGGGGDSIVGIGQNFTIYPKNVTYNIPKGTWTFKDKFYINTTQYGDFYFVNSSTWIKVPIVETINNGTSAHEFEVTLPKGAVGNYMHYINVTHNGQTQQFIMYFGIKEPVETFQQDLIIFLSSDVAFGLKTFKMWQILLFFIIIFLIIIIWYYEREEKKKKKREYERRHWQ